MSISQGRFWMWIFLIYYIRKFMECSVSLFSQNNSLVQDYRSIVNEYVDILTSHLYKEELVGGC